ncbi:N-formylglutamate amidohydrolase [Alkalicella caledoniensis]|uniref:N-formylglutamate amidohydrolase n=1 Tax=Alkalicella caledoniensis TaxID=2731377 RepID=A0A7G9W6B7_ALKCA|nr:N-formylglutamate amidohydrolase [Alkalicella caledoniensis]QNO14229.1 N-formylglutamate amidohydrolase [Alkalicella caledoniensis]
MNKLPILISVPHGGLIVPKELKEKCLLTPQDILRDGDTWTKELYDFKNLAQEYVDTDIARAVLDMNRSQDDLPPINPDGIVKTVTVDGAQIWNEKSGLTKEEIHWLISNYHIPYHKKLQIAAKNNNVVLAVDCHSMLDTGPSKNQSWQKRPLFCLSNRGSEQGLPVDEPITAPAELMIKLKGNIEREFEGFNKYSDLPLVTVNNPFKGGYITSYHGRQGKIPWIQLEINRRLYLPKIEEIDLIPDEITISRIKDIKDMLYRVFKDLLT